MPLPSSIPISYPNVLSSTSLMSSSIEANHPLSLLPKTRLAYTILHHRSTIHVSFAISPPALPPRQPISAFLQKVAALLTCVGTILQVLASHFWQEPRRRDRDGLGRQAVEVLELEAVEVGIRVLGTNSVVGARVGGVHGLAREDGG